MLIWNRPQERRRIKKERRKEEKKGMQPLLPVPSFPSSQTSE
jgi:hypothetical protein